MRASQTSLTEGSIWKSMVAFALPLFLGNVFQQFYNTFDSWVVGRFLGDKALAAVSSSGSLIFLMIGFFNGLSMGAGVVISQHYGAKNIPALRRSIHTSVALGLTAGLVLTVVGVAFSPTILGWMKTPADVMDQSVEYFRFYFLGAVFTVLYNIFVGILQAVGDSRHPLYFLMISTVTNMVLDLVFVAGFGWGVGSAAIATTLSQGLSAVLCGIHLIKIRDVFRLEISEIRFQRESLRDILYIGVPSGVQNAMISLANVVVQASINSFGAAAMAGCGTYSKLEGFAFLPVVCFSQALSTFVGQNIGAKQYDRVKKGAAFGISCCLVMAELVGITAWMFAPKLISFFNSSPEVIDFGTRHMRSICLFYFLMSFSHCTAAVLRGAGRAIVPMFTMLIFWCIVRVSYIMVVMRLTDQLEAISRAYPITWTCSGIVFLIYLFKADWVHGVPGKMPA